MDKNIQSRFKRSLSDYNNMHVKHIILLLISLITTPLLHHHNNTTNAAEGKWCTRFAATGQQDSTSPHTTTATNFIIDDEATKISNNTTPVIERFCCEGYYLNGTDCERLCDTNCLNGICKGNGECICIPGYAFHKSSKKCEPMCYSGYEFNTNSGKCEAFCKPLTNYFHCKLNCKLSNCFAIGYRQDSSIEVGVNTNYRPNCTSNCGFGSCTSPGVCTCHAGYKFNNNTNICEPVCDQHCPPNSKCVQTNVCACNRGFKLEPRTKKRCKSLHNKIFSYYGSLPKESNPSSEDIIRKMMLHRNCDKGYRFDAEVKKCIPICYNNCLYGNCTAPDVCVCLPGYSLDLQTQVCVANACKIPCDNGYCIESGDCVCLQGLTKSLFRGSGCEEFLPHTIKIVLIFLGVAAVIAFIIWLITLAERRRDNR